MPEQEQLYIDSLQQAKIQLAEARAALRDVAQPWLDEFWLSHWMGRKNHSDYRDWSILGVRARQRGDDFYLLWFWNKWITNKQGKKVPISTHIRKGRGYQYPEARLTRYARGWEVDVVLEVEAELANIRKRLHYIKRAERTLNRLIKQHNQKEVELHDEMETASGSDDDAEDQPDE